MALLILHNIRNVLVNSVFWSMQNVDELPSGIYRLLILLGYFSERAFESIETIMLSLFRDWVPPHAENPINAMGN